MELKAMKTIYLSKSYEADAVYVYYAGINHHEAHRAYPYLIHTVDASGYTVMTQAVMVGESIASGAYVSREVANQLEASRGQQFNQVKL